MARHMTWLDWIDDLCAPEVIEPEALDAGLLRTLSRTAP